MAVLLLKYGVLMSEEIGRLGRLSSAGRKGTVSLGS